MANETAAKEATNTAFTVAHDEYTELEQTAGERDTQRAVAEQRAREAEAQTAELQRARTALEQKEAEL